MDQELKIVLTEDNKGHATLIRKNLRRSGIKNEIIHFTNGQDTLDYFFKKGDGLKRESGIPHLLLLDIKMPGINGLEVLSQLKKDSELRKLPVIMITTTDNPIEIEKCHKLGCSNYITKTLDYSKFVKAIKQLGIFLTVIKIPQINGVI
jgi:CheY-like chemotaxis protein